MKIKLRSFLIALFLLGSVSGLTVYSQTGLYTEKLFGAGSPNDVVYDSGRNLKIRIVKPTAMSFPDSAFPNGHPTVIVIHGGGWQVNGGDKYDGLALSMATEELVKRGYIVASVQYRLMPQMNGCVLDATYKNSLANLPGKPYGSPIRNVVGFGVEAYRAAQDSRNAIKYIFDNSASIGADRRNIFLLGQSAGAYNVLHSILVDDKDLEPYNIAVVTEGKLAPRQDIRGAIAMSGAIFDINFIDSDDKTPLLLTYFSNDPVVPSNSAKVLPLCTLASLFDPFPVTSGSDSIIQKYRQIGLPAPEYLRIDAIGHVGSTQAINTKIQMKIVEFLKSKIQ